MLGHEDLESASVRAIITGLGCRDDRVNRRRLDAAPLVDPAASVTSSFAASDRRLAE